MNELYITRHQRVETDQILYLESESNYTLIYTISTPKIVAALTLGTILERLDSNNFIRLSRSHIINLSYLSAYRHENNKLIIKLSDGREFTASRRRVKAFQSIFKETSKDLSW